MNRGRTQAERDLAFLTGALHAVIQMAERKAYAGRNASEAKNLAVALQRDGFARPDTVES